MKSPVILHDLRLPLGHTDADLAAAAARRAGRPAGTISPENLRILRKSVDARHKSAIILQYSVELDPQPLLLAGIGGLLPSGAALPPSRRLRPVIAGAGPAGLFAALYLALAGQRPILLERGRPVDERQADVARFWQSGQLNASSNVQFGEGGAGTFSDGKLTTGIRDPRCRAVLEEFVLSGAPAEILFLAKPHVGTDYLRTIVRMIRDKICTAGGEIRFSTCLTGLQINRDGSLGGLVLETGGPDGRTTSQEMAARQLIMAVGHSARDTFTWLADLPVNLEPKPFAMGVRIEHDQSLIDRGQYGRHAGHPQLPPAEYKLACHLPSGRSVYTFCMCPGGQVVASASEPGGVVTNGMSHHARLGANANSALLVGIEPADFPSSGALGGLLWQRELEQQAFALGGGEFRAPAERVGSFLNQSAAGSQINSHPAIAAPLPTYQPGVAWRDLSLCLPSLIRNALKEALPILDRRLPGFAAAEAVLTGVETRSSSPLRLPRNELLQAAISGLFPCGEGAGYAGGIMSAAVDGLRCAEAALLQ